MSAMFEEIERQRGSRDASLTGSYAGTIAETASAVTDEVPVLLDAFDPSLQFGPCRWTPRVEPHVINVAQGAETTNNFTVATVKLPARGDRCLVAFDDQQVPWIVVWWPA